VAQEQGGQVRAAADVVDAQVGLVDHLGHGRMSEVGQLDGLELDHRPATGFGSGAEAGSRATTSQDRWVAS
jgi:hypothetical protein